MKLLQLFSYFSLDLFTKNFESLLSNLLVQGGIICVDVAWCSGFKKGVYNIYNFYIGLHDIVEGIGSNSQVDPSHGAPICSSIIVGDGRSNM